MIIDTFIFNNELDILEIHLETMYYYVDYFVLVESNQTFTLKHSPKELTFEVNKDRFKKYLDKIIHVKLIDEFKPNNPWRNEYLQRNAIWRGLGRISPRSNDLVIMGDVDEIPNPLIVKECYLDATRGKIYTFKQKMSRYFLNLTCTHELWKGSRMTSFARIRDGFAGLLEPMRHVDEVYVEGGWHLTGMGGVEMFIKKMQSFSHADICDTPEYTDVENMKKRFYEEVILNGRDVHHFNNATYRIEPNYPPCVVSDIDKYRHLIYEGNKWS